MVELLGRWEYQACERNDFKRSEAYEAYVRLLELTMKVAAVKLQSAGLDS